MRWKGCTHHHSLERSLSALPLWRVPETFDAVPDTSSKETKPKSSTDISDDAMGARVSVRHEPLRDGPKPRRKTRTAVQNPYPETKYRPQSEATPAARFVVFNSDRSQRIYLQEDAECNGESRSSREGSRCPLVTLTMTAILKRVVLNSRRIMIIYSKEKLLYRSANPWLANSNWLAIAGLCTPPNKP